MTEATELWDSLTSFAGLMSLKANLKDKLEQIASIKRKECGHCNHWMTKQCPREYNQKGYQRGPSCSEYDCDMFSRKDYVIKLENKYQKECEEIKMQINKRVNL